MAKSRAKPRVLKLKASAASGALAAEPKSKEESERFVASYVKVALEASMLVSEVQQYLLKALTAAHAPEGLGATLWYTHDVESGLNRLRPLVTALLKSASGAYANSKRVKEKKE